MSLPIFYVIAITVAIFAVIVIKNRKSIKVKAVVVFLLWCLVYTVLWLLALYLTGRGKTQVFIYALIAAPLFGVAQAMIPYKKSGVVSLPGGFGVIFLSSVLSLFSLYAALPVFGNPIPPSIGMDFRGMFVILIFIFAYPVIAAVTYLITCLILRYKK
jgi:hypothetical protein